jgi:glutaredoxin
VVVAITSVPLLVTYLKGVSPKYPLITDLHVWAGVIFIIFAILRIVRIKLIEKKIMKNKVIIPTILFVIVLIFSFFALSQTKDKDKIVAEENQQTDSQIILYYGDGCPHCAIVEEYIDENKIEDLVSFEQKEVYYNRSNAEELQAKAKICGLPTNSIGVPFLWDGRTCLIGDQDIINFFKQKSNSQ